MEKGILNYSPTVMFRGTPCRYATEHLVQVSFLEIKKLLAMNFFLKERTKTTFILPCHVYKYLKTLFIVWEKMSVKLKPQIPVSTTITVENRICSQ